MHESPHLKRLDERARKTVRDDAILVAKRVVLAICILLGIAFTFWLFR